MPDKLDSVGLGVILELLQFGLVKVLEVFKHQIKDKSDSIFDFKAAVSFNQLLNHMEELFVLPNTQSKVFQVFFLAGSFKLFERFEFEIGFENQEDIGEVQRVSLVVWFLELS